jgi:hypothetical protein
LVSSFDAIVILPKRLAPPSGSLVTGVILYRDYAETLEARNLATLDTASSIFPVLAYIHILASKVPAFSAGKGLKEAL